MTIQQICQRNVETIREFNDLTAAAQLMREKRIGYLVVVAPDLVQGGLKPVGVLTDRDVVVAVVAGGVDAKTLRVGDLMTRHPGADVAGSIRKGRQIEGALRP